MATTLRGDFGGPILRTLNFQWEIAEGVGTALIPRLLLQPLVENAVKHGALRRDSGGLVVVRIARADELSSTRLVCSVHDNGSGTDGAACRPEGFGLRAVRRRLELKYSDAALHLRFSANSTGGDCRAAAPRGLGHARLSREPRPKRGETAVSEAIDFRTLVVEDELPARNLFVELLQASQLAEAVSVRCPDVEQAEQALAEVSIDVAFVDIQLAGSGDSAGLEFVRTGTRVVGAPMFVLATAFQAHAVEAFELGVVDYLLEPFTEERVEQCLTRLLARRPVLQKGPLRIVARRGKSLVFLNLEEVWAFEASDA